MRTHCIVCGAPLYKQALLECKGMPRSAQHFPTAAQLADDQPIDFGLMQCSGCGLVQLNADPIHYYRDVIRSGGYSTTMRNLRSEEYARFLEAAPLNGKKVIEIGCGQGEFLRIWRDGHFPVEVFGIENDANLVEIARSNQLNVWQGFAADEETTIPGGPYDAFTCFNFLEHQPDPNGMLRCIYQNLKPEAYGLVTVPSLEYIIEQKSYYELIRDHLAYYSGETFRFLLEKNGFRVLSLRMINRDTWEAIVEKKRLLDASGISENMAVLKREISDLIESLECSRQRIALWGASHQGLTILSSTRLGEVVPYVVDSAPFKQGRYTIGSHIPIVAPEHIRQDPVDVIMIVAPGYTDEIAQIIRRDYGPGIRIIALRSNHLEQYEQQNRTER